MYIDNVEYTPYEQALLKTATRMVAAAFKKARSVERPKKIRCHELARAVGTLLHLKVEDGVGLSLDGPVEHSWLRTPRGKVLDVLALDRLPMVQLVPIGDYDLVCLYHRTPLKLRVPVDPLVVAALVATMGPHCAIPKGIRPDTPFVAIQSHGKVHYQTKEFALRTPVGKTMSNQTTTFDTTMDDTSLREWAAGWCAHPGDVLRAVVEAFIRNRNMLSEAETALVEAQERCDSLQERLDAKEPPWKPKKFT